MSDVLVCSNEKKYRIISSELFNKWDISCKHLNTDDCLVKIRKISRTIEQADKLIVDLDDITTATVVAMSFAYSYNVEIIGMFGTDMQEKRKELIEENKGQLLDLCDELIEMDDIGDVVWTQ